MECLNIALDAMSGNYSPGIIVPAIVQALVTKPELIILLVNDLEISQPHTHKAFPSRFTI